MGAKCVRFVMVWLAVLLLAACDKLESGDIGEVLVGRWAFSYKTSEPIDYELSYRTVTFEADGSCALNYDGGAFEGTFRASESLIRIVTNVDGQERTLMWQVLSMSPYRIVADYDYEYSDGGKLRMTVTLDRL